MVIRVFKVIIGILLLPFCVAVGSAFAAQLNKIHLLSRVSANFLHGVIIYMIMHLVLYKPNYFYVLGHELAHALATFLCGGKVRSFRLSARGGGVLTTKSNFFIALFPYFFPTYTMLLWFIYLVFALFYTLDRFVPLFLFLVGFTLTLHIIMTIEAMKIKQTDIFKTGYLFSVSLIFILNVFLVSFILSLVFPGFSFTAFFRRALADAGGMYFGFYQQMFL